MFSDALGFAHYVPDTRYFFFKAGIFRLEHGKTFARATPRDTTQKLSKCQLPPYNYTKKIQLAAAIASARRQGHTVLCGQSFF